MSGFLDSQAITEFAQLPMAGNIDVLRRNGAGSALVRLFRH